VQRFHTLFAFSYELKAQTWDPKSRKNPPRRVFWRQGLE